jgi:predicted permease
MNVVLETTVPVFTVIALGFWLAGRRTFDAATLADLALLVSSPCLVLASLSRADFDWERWALLAGGGLWILAGTGALATLYVRRSGRSLRGLVLPATFWNAGNMGLPCAQLAFGPEGLEAGLLLFVAVALAQFSAGIWIAKGQGGLREALRLPLLWAALAGLTMAATGWQPPNLLRVPVEMLGAMAIPLMLLNLGIQLRRLVLSDVRHAVVAVAIRMGGGSLLAALYVSVFSLGGADRSVLLLAGVLPAAVMNAVLAERYGASPAAVASAVVLGTLVSIVSIPAVVYWLS